MRMTSNLAAQGLLCKRFWRVVDLTEQTSNQMFEVLQEWEAELHDVSVDLKPPP